MSNLVEISPPATVDPCPEAHIAVIGHVLVCLDRSVVAGGSLPYARFVAEAFGARITLLHVMPSPPGEHEPHGSDALEWEIAKREADQYLSQARSSLGASAPQTLTRLVQGVPAEQIVAIAREIGADLTVLSTHGESGRSAAELGSVAHHVLALGARSILLSPLTCSARVPPNRILVPLDGSLRSESVLPIVAALARHHDSELLLVHVVTEPTSTAILCGPDDMTLALSLASRVEAKAEEYLARIRVRLLPQVPAVTTFVARRADERQALLDIGADHSADMLVLTAHGATCNAERAFGNVASYLLAHARLPIFAFQDMPHGQRDPAPGAGARSGLSVRPLEMD